MKLIVLILISICCFWTSIEAGQIYEWIDPNGVKHFSDEPPPPGATIVNDVRGIDAPQSETLAPESTPAGTSIAPPGAGDSADGGEEAAVGDPYEKARIGDPGEQAGIGDPGESENIGDPGEEANIGDPEEEKNFD